MVKAYSLQPYEMEQAAAIQQEGAAAATAYGNLAIQLKDAETRLAQVGAKQRCLIEVVAKRCDVPQNFTSARIETANLLVEVPDEPLPSGDKTGNTIESSFTAQTVNGHDVTAQ